VLTPCTWSVFLIVAGAMGCAQAPRVADTPLPAACGNSKAVACFAREAQGRVERCYVAMATETGNQGGVVDACARFTDEDIEQLYNRARDEALLLRGVTADLQRYYEHWRETWTVLEWRYLYGASPRAIQDDVAALRAQSQRLVR
jgi:hypothetical protein